MTSSLKPSLITLLPLLLVFGWLTSHMTYEPLQPGKEFTLTSHFVAGVTGDAVLSVPEGISLFGNMSQPITEGKATWNIKGVSGEYRFDMEYGGSTYSKNIIIQKDNGASEPITNFKDSVVTSLEVNQNRIVILNLFGWKIGWLGTYILSSLVFSMLLRKLLKVY